MKIRFNAEREDTHKITSYSDSSFSVKDRLITSNLLVSRQHLVENWFENNHHQSIAPRHLDIAISWQPEIILLGTGKQSDPPNQTLLSYVTSKNIGFETMATGAACRSYNILIDEGREVVACLILPGG